MQNPIHPLHPTSVYVRARHWVHAHPRTVHHAMHVAMVGAAVFALFNAGLFTVQHGRTSAMTTINGKDYGLMPIADAKKLLENDHLSQALQVSIGDKTIVLNASQAGVSVDSDKTFARLTDKSGWNSIPLVKALTSLFSGITPVYEPNQEKLAQTLKPYIADAVTEPVDASVTVPSDNSKPVVINKEKIGSAFTAELAAEQLAEAVATNNFTVKITAEKLGPKWTELDIRAFMPSIEAARKTSMTIEGEGKKVTLSPEVLLPMLKLDTTGTELKMTLDKPQLSAYLANAGQAFYVAPISTRTVQQDGNEVSRTEGKAGKKLDSDATATLAIEAFQKGVATVTPTIANVTPEVLITRTYSNTDQGLYKKIEDFAKSHSGKYRVAAVQLSGEGNRSAFYNADEHIITASTYKTFVAYAVLQKIEQGSLSMGSSTSKGTVEHCLYVMIHVSDNDCAYALQSVIGAATLDTKLKSEGYANTKLNNVVGDKHSTARDEMLLMTRLHNRELLNESSTQYLLGLMENQVYRSGIPAGSRGSKVADKVGFLYALNHDMAIVYSPKATYALVILTDGAGGWTNVRLLASEIYDFYNQ